MSDPRLLNIHCTPKEHMFVCVVGATHTHIENISISIAMQSTINFDEKLFYSYICGRERGRVSGKFFFFLLFADYLNISKRFSFHTETHAVRYRTNNQH